jgi:uncharacterized integral membrane protein (TIGR00698 family)
MVVALLSLELGALEQSAFGQPLLEPLVLALLLGVVVRTCWPASVAAAAAGANLAAKQILEVSVALLGASVYFPQLIAAGPALLAVVVLGVAAGICVGYLVGKAFGLETKLAVLVAVGNAICGNSAIAAVAPVIRAERRHVVSAVGLTAVMGVCLVLTLPLLIGPLALSNYQYGVLAGMSVYAVPQVVAAAFPVSQLSGEVATLVKLTRILTLGPVVVIMGVLFGGGAARRSVMTYLPWFVLGFLGLATLRSIGVVPNTIAEACRQLSGLLMVLAMAGLGYGVELASVQQVGARVGAAVLGCLLFMGTFTLVLLYGLHVSV